MAENQKFATIEELPEEERVVGAEVDNADGEYTIGDKKYLVADGKIAEIMDEVAETEEPTTEATSDDEEDMKKFMADVLGWMAETQARLEELTAKVNGIDETSNEEFKKVSDGVEKLQTLLSLLPKKDETTQEPEFIAGSVMSALNKIKAESKI